MKTILNPFKERYKLTLSFEVVSECPITHKLDVYHVSVEYYPKLVCLEVLDLKDFINKFYYEELFMEEIANNLFLEIGDRLDVPFKLTIKDSSPGIRMKLEVGDGI